MEAPLILTLTLDFATQAFFDGLRARHFPPERNFLPAHLTLFHALPGQSRVEIEALLHDAASVQTEALQLTVTGLLFFGQGVAYAVNCPKLTTLHATLQHECSARFALTPQDQRRLRPHITIQNKAAPATARALFEERQTDFAPFTANGTGLQLWAYQDGPWEPLTSWAFGA